MFRGKLAVRNLVALVGLEHLSVFSGISLVTVPLPVELLTAAKRFQTLQL